MTTTEEYNEVQFARMLDTFPLNQDELKRILKIQTLLLQVDCSIRGIAESPSPVHSLVDDTLLPSSFLGTLIGNAVVSAFVVGAPTEQQETWTYLEAVVTCLGRRGPRPLNDLVFSYCEHDNNADSKTVLALMYRLILASHTLQNDVSFMDTSLEAPLSWLSTVPDRFSRALFVEWVTKSLPFFYTAVSTLIHYSIFSPSYGNVRPGPFRLPNLDLQSLLWSSSWDHIPVSLACISSGTGCDWRRLYSSNEDAFSFRAFANALIGYRGPTILLIKSTSDDVFGFYSDSPWKFSDKWHGQDSDSFLFTLHPQLRVYNATGEGKNYQYLNLPPSHRQDKMKGMAIGGIAHDCPRLRLTESLERCMASSVDRTFEDGPILSDDMQSYFDVDILEVFAANVSEPEFRGFLENGALQVAIREATRKQVASVDRSQFLDDFAAGAFLNKGFEHREHSDGRHEFRQEDEN